MVTLIAMFQRNIPRDARGAMNGLFHAFGLLGLTLYSFCAGKLFQNMGPASPFTLLSYIDLFVFILAVLFALFGYLK